MAADGLQGVFFWLTQSGGVCPAQLTTSTKPTCPLHCTIVISHIVVIDGGSLELMDNFNLLLLTRKLVTPLSDREIDLSSAL